MEGIFAIDMQEIPRTLAVGVLTYLLLVCVLRVSGKRTLAKWNAFDLIVTISLGSILATTVLNAEVSLSEGFVAFAVLVALQFIVTWTSVRAPWIRRFVTGEPLLLLSRGQFIPSAMKRARVTEDEVRAAVRSAGIGDLGMVEAVVIETDGSFSVVRHAGSSSLSDVRGYVPPDRDAR